MCLVLEWKTGLRAKAIDPWLSPFSGMTISSSPPPTRCVKVVKAVLDGVSARVLFGDLDQGVLLVWLEESQFREQQSEPRCFFCGQS